MSAKDWFKDFGKGSVLGTGILPGVSVGTVGLIVNIYDKLLTSIDGLRKKATFKSSLLALIPIGAGCLIATFFLMLFWSKVAYLYFPFIIVSALAGFVVGALPIILAELKDKPVTKGDVLRIVLGFLFAAAIGVVSFLCAGGIIPLNIDLFGAVEEPFANAWIFPLVVFVGFFSAASCLIPGISGAMVLFIFGLYNPIVNLFIAVRDPQTREIIHHSLLTDTSRIGGGIVIIACLLVGMLVGFLVISKILKGLFKNKRHETFSVVLGFILGSVISMFFNNDMYGVYTDPRLSVFYQYLLGAIAFFLVGGVTFYFVHRKLKRPETAEKSSEN